MYNHPTGGDLVMKISGLRVDFEVFLLEKFNRAKFTIYNMNNDAITSLMSGDHFITLKTQLGNKEERIIANRYFLNNATDELKHPNRITNLYCFDKMKKEVLDKQVDITVEGPTLRTIVEEMLNGAGHNGKVNYLSFPKGLVETTTSKRPRRVVQGDVQKCLTGLEAEYNFSTYIVGEDICLMYKPYVKDVDKTDLATKEPDITFSTEAMRSNPRIGIASANIVSILDANLLPTKYIDLSKLLTVQAFASEPALLLNKGYLKNFSANTKYQIYTVVHMGSNFTDVWQSSVYALSPQKGEVMATSQAAWMRAYSKE